MRKIHCINAISKYGTDQFTEDYELTDEVNEAEGILVRSASLHEMQFSNSLLAIARAGAGVNNIPLDACAQEGIVVFNTPGANANGVKELVLAGLFLASRDIVGGIEWCKENKDDANIGKTAEKAKKAFAGCEIKGKKLGVVGLGAIGAEVANAAIALGMEVYGYDPYISVNAAWRLSRDVKHTTSLDTICQECDYITLHVLAVDSTKGMINKAAFAADLSHHRTCGSASGGSVNLTLLQSMLPQKAAQTVQAVHLTLHSILSPFYKFARIHVTMPLSLHFLVQHLILPNSCIYFAVFSSVSIYTFGICIEVSYLSFWLL